LHPKWQRRIIGDLRRTFPKIQFICTTHSPQIIGEAKPDEIILLRGGQTEHESQSYGMDSNWILKNIMGSSDRNAEVAKELDTIFELIEEGDFDEAREHIDALRAKIGEHPSLVRADTIIDRYTRIGE
jgi:predicted ATP-binding protein involved in virulence